MDSKNELMNWKQIYEYFGKNIGRDRIYQLMKENFIPSIWLGNKLVSRKKYVDEFADSLFKKPINNGIIETIPTQHIQNVIKKQYN